MAVDADIGDIGEELGRAVSALDLLEQLRRLVDELGGVGIVAELLVADDGLEEGQVGGDAADAELAQRPVHAGDRLLRRRRPGGDLFEQRVVVAGDDRAGIGGAAVEPDAEAGGAAIGGDAAIVRNEIVLGILGGDPALQRMAVELDVLLGRDTGFGRADRVAVEDVDLRLDDVDAGHLLGDGVLDLDARIDLDEVEVAGVGVHQELDRAGADIVGRVGELAGIAGEFAALLVVQIRRRRALDHLLIAALDRAVALEEVDDIAMGVAEDLHLDMAGPLDQLFEIDLVLAEGGLGLALGLGHLALEVLLGADDAHAAAAAAPGRLQHHREADLRRHLPDRRHVVGQRLGRRHDGHADLDGEIARGDLVAEPAHGIARRADEGDAGLAAGVDEFRALRQQAVAGMDRVRAGDPGDAQDLLDRQIGLDRPHVLVEMRAAADLIALVRLEAVEGQLVLLRPDRHRPEPELVGGAEHANGDFGSVGDENLTDGQGTLPFEQGARLIADRPECSTLLRKRQVRKCEEGACRPAAASPVADERRLFRPGRLLGLAHEGEEA